MRLPLLDTLNRHEPLTAQILQSIAQEFLVWEKILYENGIMRPLKRHATCIFLNRWSLLIFIIRIGCDSAFWL